LTLAEAIKLFDRMEPGQDFWFTIDGESVGIPYCCELPVVLNSQDGVSIIHCQKCGRTIQFLSQWVVTDWGTKGIKFPRQAPEFDHAPDEIEMQGGITHLPAEFREVAKKANAAGLAGFEVVGTEIGTDWESIEHIELYRREFRTRIQITYRKAET